MKKGVSNCTPLAEKTTLKKLSLIRVNSYASSIYKRESFAGVNMTVHVLEFGLRMNRFILIALFFFSRTNFTTENRK